MKRSGNRRKPLKDALTEARLFRTRAATGFALIALAMSLIGVRFTWLQVAQHEEFTTRSEANRVRLRALAPNRGLVYDRSGRLLADNRPAYRLQLVPEQVDDVEAVLGELSRIVSLSTEDLDRFRELNRARPDFQAIPIRLRLTEQEAARFAVNRHRFSGVDIVAYESRHYPYGRDLAHVLGYVGLSSKEIA